MPKDGSTKPQFSSSSLGRWLVRIAVVLLTLIVLYSVTGFLRYHSLTTLKSPAHKDIMPHVEKVEKLTLILIGDTGSPGKRRDRVMNQVRREDKDYIVALGDLIYPRPLPCPNGSVSKANWSFYEERVAKGLENLGAPVWAILGNHAYYRTKASIIDRLFPFIPKSHIIGENTMDAMAEPAACMVDFIGQRPQIHLPGLDYGINFGVAQIAFVDTNHLDAQAAELVRSTFAAHPGKKLLFGHHVLRTYHDKKHQDVVRPWLEKHGFKPDLYGNGHAHLLQFGIYNDIPAITSGSASKLRKRKACPPHCGDGQTWGESVPGYAIVTVTSSRMDVVFKDDTGEELYRWSSNP